MRGEEDGEGCTSSDCLDLPLGVHLIWKKKDFVTEHIRNVGGLHDCFGNSWEILFKELVVSFSRRRRC